MRNLMQKALDHFDQSETYQSKKDVINLQFQNSQLQSIDNNILSGISLRAIKNDHLGFAYTRNLLSENDVIDNARKSLLGKVHADYSFPHSPLVEALDSYDQNIQFLDTKKIAEECKRISSYISSHTNAETEIYANRCIDEINIVNSNGTDLSHKSSHYNFYVTLVYPGSASGVSYNLYAKNFQNLDHEILDGMIKRYTEGNKFVSPESGEMQVLFMPMTSYALTWRLAIGSSAESIYSAISPIAEKRDVRIFDSKLSFYTDPLNDNFPGSRPFDDEATVCHRHHIVDNGILLNFYNDLNYAAKLKIKNTGHGFKNSIAALPKPSIHNLFMKPGTSSLSDMIKGMKRGLILEGVMGAHSGNLANGDFSIGVSPGLYVENGEIKGRVKEGMVSGNIYSALRKVDALEDQLHSTYSGFMPAILLDEVHVDL